MIVRPNEPIFIQVYGDHYKITAIFSDDKECNEYLEQHKDEGVISSMDNFSFCAKLNDKGKAKL